MRIILNLLAAFLFSVACFAQGQIRGQIKAEGLRSPESATISLLRLSDSALQKFAVASREGRFIFENIPAGQYMVSVTLVGYSKTYSSPFEWQGIKDLDLQPVVLTPLAKALNEVVVTATKPFLEQKIDKMVINVDASLTNAGSTALDVLERSPGVTVDKDGNISIRGKQNVLVLLDGRPSYISGADLANYLKGLPASAIDQIEIMTNPPAKYDASGNSGIINIKSKKNRQSGFNGNVALNYGQGRYPKTNNSLALNYRSGKWNLFANTSANFNKRFQVLEINRKFKNPTTKDVEAIFDQVSDMRNRNFFMNLRIGADYFLTRNTILGIVATGFINPSKYRSENTSYLQDMNGTVDSVVYALSKNENDWNNGSVNLNFRHQFDSTGRELTADLDYVLYRSSSTQGFMNDTYDPNGALRVREELRGDLPVDVNIYSAKADYTQPIRKWNGRFDAGVKSSFVKTLNEANYFTISGTGETIDYSKTNHFNYEEQINAAYVSVNRQYKKIGVQAGLRYEHTSYSGRQHGNPTQPDSSFKRTYGSLFTTVFVSYAPQKDHQFGASFGRRIDRPAYRHLNPFLLFLDKFTYEAGNPFLKPQFTNNFELNHIFKNKITTTLHYSHTKDDQNETFEQGSAANGTEDYATIVREGNIGKRDNAGISVNAQLTVFRWWSASLYTGFNYNKFTGRLNSKGEYIDVEASTMLFNANNQFKFGKGWSAELSGFYRTKSASGQILNRPQGQFSAGIGKQILKGKGTLRLNVRDIFYTQMPRGYVNFENTEAYFENRRDSRVGNLTFTYRFGKPQKNTPRRKTGGAEEEQNRVQF